jgi:hypothetical protein
MTYAKITNGEVELYPATLSKLMELNFIDNESPTSDQLTAAGIVEVERSTVQPVLNQFKYDLKPVQQEDGSWKEVWVQVESSENEQFAKTEFVKKSVVLSRNRLLQSSDWTQLADASIPNKQEWAAYRQALRDIPEQAGFPFEVNWPTQP